ncbi:MAG: hypothetical protein WBM08_03600 [Prochlorococcaceae cyanobacterium]
MTATFDGTAADASWRWVKPAGSSAPASTSNVLEWSAVEGDEGLYSVEVTSPSATDSPVISAEFTLSPPAPPEIPAFDDDAAAVLNNVINVRGGTVTQPVQDAYHLHVGRLKQKGLWDGGEGESFCYFAGVSGTNKLIAQSSWIRKDAMGDNWDFYNMVDADHDTLNGIKGDGISKYGHMTRQINLEGNSTWIVITTENPNTSDQRTLVGYTGSASGGARITYGHWTTFDACFAAVGGSGTYLADNVATGFSGSGASRSAVDALHLATIDSAIDAEDATIDPGEPSPAQGPTVWAENDKYSGAWAFSEARIFLVWCRPNTMTPFSAQQMSDFIAEVKQYYDELQAVIPAK